MDFLEYSEYLLDIGIEWNRYKRTPILIFSDCLRGEAESTLQNLNNLLEKPMNEYNQKDAMSLWWVLKKIKGGK